MKKDFKIIRFPVTDSTNKQAMIMAENGCPEWTTVMADFQTSGRGRGEHTFFSPSGTGLYMSVVLRPKMKINDSLLLTIASASAAARAIDEITGKTSGIKWVNDIYLENKKVCGILAQSAIGENNTLKYAVIGIGVNISPPKDGFPADIADKAGTILTTSSPEVRDELAEKILTNLAEYYPLLNEKPFKEDYKSRLFFLGENVDVIFPDHTSTATALDIDDDFGLTVKFPDGKIQTLSSGEISIKPKNNY